MQDGTQDVTAAAPGLNGSGTGHGMAPVAVAPVAAMPVEMADTPPVLTEKARLEMLMEDPVRRADIHRRITTTDEPKWRMAVELGIGKGTFSRWLAKQAWPRPETAPKAPQRRRSEKRKPADGDRDIAAVTARLISAVDRQIGLVEKPQSGRKADVEEKDYRALDADALVAEINQGGDMVEAVLREVDPGVPVTKVRATRGKWLRAEPVAALYAQGRVRHAGVFRDLEDEMADFGPDGLSLGRSPDRLDALVWAITALMLGEDGEPRIRGM